MLAVASSIRMILLFFRTALAIQINYFSPALRFAPFSYNSLLSPFSIKLSKQHDSAALMISVSFF